MKSKIFGTWCILTSSSAMSFMLRPSCSFTISRIATSSSTTTAMIQPHILCNRLFKYSTNKSLKKMVDNDDNNMRQSVDNLLQNAMSRAFSTLSQKEPPLETIHKNTNHHMESTSTETSNPQNYTILDVDLTMDGEVSSTAKESKNNHQDKRTYLENPSVTPTALAHSLWSQVIRPYQDVIIDATSGNGKDSLALAKFLFPHQDTDQEAMDHPTHTIPTPLLICIDIQQKACENTMQLLSQYVSKDIMDHNIRVLHQSHAPMPSLSPSSVGLICYNLGYLPGMDDKAACQTQMVTTLFSLTDATLLLRQGGLLSVMTYPGNGWKEYCAVKYFFEGLALFTSKQYDWRDFVDCIPKDYELQRQHVGMYGNHDTMMMTMMMKNNDNDEDKNIHDWDEAPSLDDQDSIRQAVKMGLERIKEQGCEKQTWRVFDHRPLGRPMSPILFTAMRIK